MGNIKMKQTKTKQKNPKYIFVVGGVMSGVGKGITSSSIALLMKARGYTVTALKIDPYINIDAGTMNPTEHGEVFVLDDGDECDQDMGNYERFLDTTLLRINYMTTGRVYEEIIRRERNLEYKGKNVEVVPDVPKEVIRRIKVAQQESQADVVVIEIGGTIGEYQNIIFLEAGRMLKSMHPEDVSFVMVSYLPTPSKVGEMKTKPTQYAARTLNSAGIQADVIVARSDTLLDKKRKEKIGTFCNINTERVISAPDVESIYDVPVNFEKDMLGEILSSLLALPNHRITDLSLWKKFVAKNKRTKKEVTIGVVGKYFNSGSFVLSDVYISVLEAIKFSAYQTGVKANIQYLSAQDFESGAMKLSDLKKCDGILIPGGFGATGIEGKLSVIHYARENGIPYFGLCYGMQLLVIEYARNKAKLKGAHTKEIDPDTAYPVIDVMPDQKDLIKENRLGGTMRLGGYPCALEPNTIASKAYGVPCIRERHRHRYEVNPDYVEKLESTGLVFSGKSPDGKLMEIVELPNAKSGFHVGTQFHPEFLARPLSPHPLFSAFIKATIKGKKK